MGWEKPTVTTRCLTLYFKVLWYGIATHFKEELWNYSRSTGVIMLFLEKKPRVYVWKLDNCLVAEHAVTSFSNLVLNFSLGLLWKTFFFHLSHYFLPTTVPLDTGLFQQTFSSTWLRYRRWLVVLKYLFVPLSQRKGQERPPKEGEITDKGIGRKVSGKGMFLWDLHKLAQFWSPKNPISFYINLEIHCLSARHKFYLRLIYIGIVFSKA